MLTPSVCPPGAPICRILIITGEMKAFSIIMLVLQKKTILFFFSINNITGKVIQGDAKTDVLLYTEFFNCYYLLSNISFNIKTSVYVSDALIHKGSRHLLCVHNMPVCVRNFLHRCYEDMISARKTPLRRQKGTAPVIAVTVPLSYYFYALLLLRQFNFI